MPPPGVRLARKKKSSGQIEEAACLARDAAALRRRGSVPTRAPTAAFRSRGRDDRMSITRFSFAHQHRPAALRALRRTPPNPHRSDRCSWTQLVSVLAVMMSGAASIHAPQGEGEGAAPVAKQIQAARGRRSKVLTGSATVIALRLAHGIATNQAASISSCAGCRPSCPRVQLQQSECRCARSGPQKLHQLGIVQILSCPRGCRSAPRRAPAAFMDAPRCQQGSQRHLPGP